jgi:hypothetical protein
LLVNWINVVVDDDLRVFFQMFFQGFKINSGFTNFLRFEILGLKIEEEG